MPDLSPGARSRARPRGTRSLGGAGAGRSGRMPSLSPAIHENFESLKVLAAHPAAPWQATSQGFVPGEAAVALRITRNGGAESGVQVGIPMLRQDLGTGDGLRDVVTAFRSRAPSVVVGQGTGPWAVDTVELDALDSLPNRRTP